jgi:hypothetical protein
LQNKKDKEWLELIKVESCHASIVAAVAAQLSLELEQLMLYPDPDPSVLQSEYPPWEVRELKWPDFPPQEPEWPQGEPPRVKPGKWSWRGCLAVYSQLPEKEAESKSFLGRLLDPEAEAGTGSGCLNLHLSTLSTKVSAILMYEGLLLCMEPQPE